MTQIDSRIQGQSEVLLKTKLVLPQIKPDLVIRSHLLQRLTENVLQSTLTLVSAPAGFGKSTLLSLWGVAGNAPVPIAWVSLEERDNISARFWTYVIAALRTLVPDCGEEALALLRLPNPPALESILVALINTLTALPHPVVLVLDDYHFITNSSIHAEFTFLLDHLPSLVHVIIAAREDPLLPLHRLRARGQLTELRADELRFTFDEITMFLHKTMHLDLASEDIAAIETRTEGWIAGLQLAALSMRGQADSSGFIASLTGNHRFILDYLAREIFHQQSKEMQDFLLYTSVLDRLSASLCNAITGRGDAQMMLEHMEQANLFLVSLDNERRWYRYHHLFADFLHERLHQTYPDALPALHQCASAWYESNGLTPEAIDHALQTGLFTRAADLIESAASSMWKWNKTNMLMKYISLLPVDLVRSRPQLCIYHAWVCIFTDWEKCQGYLRDAEHQLRRQKYNEGVPVPPASANASQMLGEVFAVRAIAAFRQYDTARAITCYQRANELLASTSTLRGLLKYNMARLYSSTGDDVASCRALEEAVVANKAAGNDLYTAYSYISLTCLQMSCGQMRQAAATCQQALRYSSTSPTGQTLLTGAACFSLYELHYEWNNLEVAQQYIEKSIEYAKRAGDVSLERTAHLLLPNLLFAQGQREQAFRLFEQEFQQIQMLTHDRVSAVARETRVRFWLEEGDLASAMCWSQSYTFEIEDERDPLFTIERSTLAQVYLAQGKTEDALRILERPLAISKQAGRTYNVLSTMSLRALALHKQYAIDAALNVLAKALSLGEPEGFVRVFADCGQPMAELLMLLLHNQQNGHHSKEHRFSQEYLLKLLSALHIQIPASEQQPRHSSVSTREIEVLRLMAGGFSTREIAKRLVIAEGTVKTHTKRIYAKLEVKSRTQAIARARIQSLL